MYLFNEKVGIGRKIPTPRDEDLPLAIPYAFFQPPDEDSDGVSSEAKELQ